MGKRQADKTCNCNSFRIFLDPPELHKICPSKVQPLPAPLTNVIGQPLCETVESRDPCSAPLQSTPSAASNTRTLFGDVRNMLLPVIDVRTKGVDPDGGRWWIHQRPPCQVDEAPCQPRSLHTTSRSDFQYRGEGIPGITRYMSNGCRAPAHGIIPASWLRPRNGCQRFLAEEISFDHRYNSRLDPNYPPKGNRQGDFVWRILPDGQVNQVLCRYEDTGDADDAVPGRRVTCGHVCPPAPGRRPPDGKEPLNSNAYQESTAFATLVWPDGCKRRS